MTDNPTDYVVTDAMVEVGKRRAVDFGCWDLPDDLLAAIYVAMSQTSPPPQRGLKITPADPPLPPVWEGMMSSLVEIGRTGKIKCPSLEPTLSERPLSSSEWREFGIKAANEIERLREALTGLIGAVEMDANDHGISGYTGARLTDAREALSIHEAKPE